MRKIVSFMSVVLLLAATLAAQPAVAQTGPKTLIVYDGPPNSEYTKLGMAYSIMLKNLIGHFDSNAELLPVHSYVAGKMQNYDATFYLGAFYDNPLPAAFLSDVATTQKTVVWFKYNLWQLAWNPAYGFVNKFGFDFASLRGLNASPSAANPAPGFFDTIGYKGKSFVKYYTFDGATGSVNADPDIGVTSVVDPVKATTLVPVSNPKTGETVPYVLRSGNFWYVADMPFSFIGPRDRYLVLTDLLHDMLGVNHAESHKALVRLEDVGAMVSVQAMKTLTDYLYARRIPFSIATIPRYVDSLGAYNGNIPQTVPMSQATNLKRALNYALPRGAEVVMHGYTHQYSNKRNPHTGVSGDDYEFWNIVTNAPVAEDSTAWAQDRITKGKAELISNGYMPVAWETPHYHSSALASKVFALPANFSTTYQRVVYFTADKPNFNPVPNKDFGVGQIFPYLIKKDYYGQRVIPENLGNIEYDIRAIDPSSNFNYTWQDIVTNAEYAKTVRDGFASFFFHPFWLEPAVGVPGYQDFQKVMTGITNLGYTWVAPSKVQ
ncbi:MAG: papd-like protein [Polaromonas sp.]|nr:papd-like protein [Polaromonas sp.]